MVNEIIKEKLRETEKRENIRIIYAAESGSRAWGFSSEDSDCDVRFVYVRSPEFYLRLGKKKDTLMCELNDIYDINGWDLNKFLTLAYGGNQSPFEWADSPIVYRNSTEWESVKDVIYKYFNGKAALHHYYNMAKNVYDDLNGMQNVKLKKYFYVLRAAVCCMFIVKKESQPRTEFMKNIDELVKCGVINDELYNSIIFLKDVKSKSNEKAETERVKCIDRFIKNCFSETEKKAAYVTDGGKKDISFADKVFSCIVLHSQTKDISD